MKTNLRHHFLLGLLIFTALFSLVPAGVFADGPSVYITPPSGTSQIGNTFTVSVDGYVGASLFGTHTATGTITFPANLLRVTSVSATGSTLPDSSVTPSNSAGTINYSQGCPWYCAANNQSVHLFTVTFQSVASGNANVSFSSAQYDGVSASSSGGSYTIAAPAPVVTPKPTTTPSTTPKPTTTPKPIATTTLTPVVTAGPTPSPVTTPTPEETPAPVVDSDGGLKITNIKVVSTRQENSISFAISNPNATPTLSYGTTKSSMKSQSDVTKQGDGSYKLVLNDLKLGTLYYFSVKASTADNLQGATYTGTFTTRGYPVQLTIQQNNLLLPSAKVTIDGRSFVANKNAIITTELSEGSHKVSIIAPGTTDAHDISFVVAKKAVPSSGNPDVQTFVLNVTVTGTSSGLNSSLLLPIIGGIATVLAVGGGIIGFVLLRRRQSNENNVSIDVDMLAANYGSAIDNRVLNTPTPNLETNSISPAIENNAYNNEPSEQAYPADTTQFQEPEVLQANNEDGSTTFDPAALPLPPLTEAREAIPDNDQQDTSQYSEVEQLAPEISSIEATEPIDPDAASAVYHDDTGELDIIHHKTTATDAMTDNGENPTDSPDELESSQYSEATENPDTITLPADTIVANEPVNSEQYAIDSLPEQPLTASQ
ncbi:MAG: Subtilisin-like protein serine protease [Candidatus Saccharibacteria bacterium]|nr:Subtilisin-like protein serine protease [Candidatus Saccharibacteria bacterium]